MLSKTEIREKVDEIICSLLCCDKLHDEQYALHAIISNSFLAISLVSIIEDEFDLEFDDEDINMNFFLDIVTIVDLIHFNQVKSKAAIYE